MFNRICFLLLALGLLTCTNAGGQNLQLRSVSNYPVDLSDIWGYSNGTNEYALVGLWNAFVVIDVTDPDNPQKLFDLTVSGPSTYWRDIKTFGHYAFGVHDTPYGGSSQGLVIMNLEYLPDSMPVKFWRGDGSTPQFNEAHNIFIDENGIAYIVGHNFGNGGVWMVDVATDPENPVSLGQFTGHYVHDCFARNDTLWTSDGSSSGPYGSPTFSAFDVSDKSNPIEIGRFPTPGNYSHNIWLSDDGRTAWTTDEVSGGYIGSFDVSDLSDISELNRWRPGGGVIPHNAIAINDFVTIAHYRDGLIILDGSVPDELVKVAGYDTAPSFSGSGFQGAWGVYPFLPSGNILVSDIETGMHVFTPDLKRSIHIRGTVSDASTLLPINAAQISITGSGEPAGLNTDLSGKFKKGFADPALFTIQVSKTGYTTWSDTRALSHGDIIDLDILLSSGNYIGNFVWEDLNENGLQDAGEPPLPGTLVVLLDENGDSIQSIITDAGGLFTFAGIGAGTFSLEFFPPSTNELFTIYQPTVRYPEDDSTIDSDVGIIDGILKTGPFTVPETGNLLNLDAGFIREIYYRPEDTIYAEIIAGTFSDICDEDSHGVLVDTTYLCSGETSSFWGSWDVSTAGCLTYTAGDSTGAYVDSICVAVTNEEGDAGNVNLVIVSVIMDPATGLSDELFGKGGLVLLKNPVSNVLYLKNMSEVRVPLNLRVADLSGRIVLKGSDNGYNDLISLPMPYLSKGMYFLIIETPEGKIGNIRFVKQ